MGAPALCWGWEPIVRRDFRVRQELAHIDFAVRIYTDLGYWYVVAAYTTLHVEPLGEGKTLAHAVYNARHNRTL